jgi:DNA polymerase elongation subunit (family B)
MEFLQLKESRRDNIMLNNIIYNQPSAQTNWVDSIDIIYKDLSDDKKYLETIINPTMDVYFTKPEYRNYDYPKYTMPIEQLEIHNISCKHATRDIAKIAGGKYAEYYRQCVETKNRKAMKNLHKYKYVMASDYDPESYYRIQFSCHYLNDKPKPITKMYSDIEVDGINVEGFVKDGVAPINAITLIDEKTRKCFTFALRNEKNPQIQELEDNLDLFKRECHNMFDESYGEFEYNILFYDEKDEIVMLKDYFNLIHTLKRDFIMFWNMNFDANYLMDRITELGYNPADIMCHPDFPVKRCYYYEDRKNFAVKMKKDAFTISDYTTWIDQMILYAQIRKGQSELGSVKLNIIGKKELGDEKLDYSEEANIKTLPYVNYQKFLLYNIKDVLLQFGIERKTSDLDNLYTRSILNSVAYKKVFSQTALLRNRCYVDYLKQGYVIGNNINLDYNKDWDSDDDEDEEKFAGALVGDPTLNSNKNGMEINGVKNKYVRKYVIDFDFSSLYPSIKIAHNIAPHTLVGKISLDEKVYDKYTAFEMNNDKGDMYDSGKDFMENILCQNPVMAGVRWFNLPNMMEILEMVAKEFDKDTSKIVPEENKYRRE